MHCCFRPPPPALCRNIVFSVYAKSRIHVFSITNVFLDILLVYHLGYGVYGAALATVLSQLLSTCLVTTKLLQLYRQRLISQESMGLCSLAEAKCLASFGFPAAIQSAVCFPFCHRSSCDSGRYLAYANHRSVLRHLHWRRTSKRNPKRARENRSTNSDYRCRNRRRPCCLDSWMPTASSS